MGDSLSQLANDLWIGDGGRVRMYLIPFATRMTVVRLPDGGLWVHSPVALEPALVSSVAALGPVRYLIAPDLIHSLFVPPCADRFPEAEVLVSPRFSKRHPDIRFDAVLTDAPPEPLAEVFDQVVVRGHVFMDEVVFLHRPSRTLIVTDLLQRHRPETDGAVWRGLKRLAGIASPDGGMPLDMRRTFSDRAAARRSVARILGWEFDRIVLAHGDCALEAGHEFANAKLGRLFG